MGEREGSEETSDGKRAGPRVRSRLHSPIPAVLVGLGLISASPGASAAVAVNDHYRTAADTPLAGLTVLANDQFANVVPRIATLFGADFGSVSFGDAFLTTVDYAPPQGFGGVDRFRYCISDRLGNACAEVFIQVGDPRPVPALGGLALAGLAGVLGSLGMRLRRRG